MDFKEENSDFFSFYPQLKYNTIIISYLNGF